MRKQMSCLCMALLLLLSLAACDKQAEEQDSTPPTVIPTEEATPEPTPEPTPPIPFTDVPEDSYYYDAVVWAYENGIASDGETFEPLSACTRGQVITFLWRAMGSPEPWIMENPFSDASPDAWYYKPALWAYQHSIITSATLNPNKACTNGEALTFLWRAEGKPDKLNTLAASGTYYGQPAAWADKNGLFAQMGAAFDPSAPCSRADLMAYLCWAAEQWTPSEEEQRIQTEYDKILYGAGNGSGYAEYADVDGDGSVELLTLGNRYNNGGNEIVIAVYADIGGHIEKSCEGIFRVVRDKWENTPEDTFLTNDGVFSLYSSDSQLYLCQNRYFYEIGAYPQDDDLYDFYRIEKEAVTFCEQRNIWTMYDRETGEIREGDTGTSRHYTKQKDIFLFDDMGPEVLERGILPDWQEYMRERERYWTAYWEAADPIYAAVLRGDFSAIAGSYEGGRYGPSGEYEGEMSAAISEDGTATGSHHMVGDEGKALVIRVWESGEIRVRTGYDVDVDYEFGYTIYPPGCAANLPVRDELSKMRISHWIGSDGSFAFLTPVS